MHQHSPQASMQMRRREQLWCNDRSSTFFFFFFLGTSLNTSLSAVTITVKSRDAEVCRWGIGRMRTLRAAEHRDT